MTIAVRYGGTPRPIHSYWGEVGFEELTNGVLVAGQPNGAASWFPCDDHPSAKASFRIQISTESPYYALANGELLSRRARAGMTTWTYEQAEPTSTYLVTLQIGMYDSHRMAKNGVQMHAVLPDRLRRNFDHDFGRQPQMMKLFVKLFGPYPLSTGYTVVVTDDDLEIPLEAQGISIFGANHCDGKRSAERLIAHELAHQWFGDSVTAKRWRHIWLHEGFACYAEWLWSEHSGGHSADEWARHYYERLEDSPQDLLLADPGPRDMFDDRVYKRGALTLHVLRRRIGDESFFALLRDWTTRYRHSTAVTDDFTGLAANYAHESLRPLWDAWLYSTPCARPGERRRDGRGDADRSDHARQRGPGRHGDRAVRAVRIRGAVSGRARSRAGGLLGVRRVLGCVRVWSPAQRSDCCRRPPARCARRVTPRSSPGRARIRCGSRRWSASWLPR